MRAMHKESGPRLSCRKTLAFHAKNRTTAALQQILESPIVPLTLKSESPPTATLS
jgi:hypothetical protein